MAVDFVPSDKRRRAPGRSGRAVRWALRSTRRAALAVLGVAGLLVAAPAPALATHGGDTEVSVGSNDNVFSQNKQNEPALAIDAAHPDVMVAGANDNIDLEACNAGDPTTCPFTPGVGTSGVYFSFNSGDSWTQPTYTGYSARGCLGPAECVPNPSGPIGTLPGYSERGLVSDGDPAVSFGPTPDASGHFSWSNGSRLYYANLTSNFPGAATFKGAEAIYVSRLDGTPALTPTIVADQDNWKAPVLVTKQSATTFSDKEQIWADNAESSPFFGNVYLCLASFRSNSQGNAAPQPLVVATSRDGGSTWTNKQVTPATNNPFNPQHGFGRSGCTVRTDSHGVVYVLANQFAVGMPGSGKHIMIRSFDGGKSWERPVQLFTAVDTCFLVQFDGTSFRCVMDGVAGARDDLSAAPSIDIANGAPTGAGATNVIYDTWVDGRSGVNEEQVLLSYSANGGTSWSAPQAIQTAANDRGYYSAVALSPDGTDAYVVYNAFTTPLRNNTTSPRGLVGVVLHSNVGAGGAPAGFTELHRGASGDPRGSSQNNVAIEFLGDYVYAAATNAYGAAVWNDVRHASDCPAVDTWRAGVQTTLSLAGRPAIQQVCPPTFGNTDIFGGSYADPS
jgi:hypothetical protein